MTSTPIRKVVQKGLTSNRPAATDRVLETDVSAMLRERHATICRDRDYDELAHDLVVVIRERVLQEIQSYARRNIR